jgi:hypothetical protein
MARQRFHTRRFQVRCLKDLAYSRAERRAWITKRRWDIRGLTVGLSLIAVVTLALFVMLAMGGCITVSITYPTADSQAQAEPSAEVGAQLGALKVHNL